VLVHRDFEQDVLQGHFGAGLTAGAVKG